MGVQSEGGCGLFRNALFYSESVDERDGEVNKQGLLLRILVRLPGKFTPDSHHRTGGF